MKFTEKNKHILKFSITSTKINEKDIEIALNKLA